jgi:hypothetical protein
MAHQAVPEGVIFEDPPGGAQFSPKGAVRAEWKRALMDRPGEWARIPIAYNAAGTVRGRSPEFEIISRTVDGTHCVYARYIGEKQAS